MTRNLNAKHEQWNYKRSPARARLCSRPRIFLEGPRQRGTCWCKTCLLGDKIVCLDQAGVCCASAFVVHLRLVSLNPYRFPEAWRRHF